MQRRADIREATLEGDPYPSVAFGEDDGDSMARETRVPACPLGPAPASDKTLDQILPASVLIGEPRNLHKTRGNSDQLAYQPRRPASGIFRATITVGLIEQYASADASERVSTR